MRRKIVHPTLSEIIRKGGVLCFVEDGEAKLKLSVQILLVALMLGLFNGSQPLSHKHAHLEQQLAELNQRGYTNEFINSDLIKVENPITGQSTTYALNGPSEQDIQAWADTHGIPILVIDPSQIDTSLYSGMYSYWTTVPIGNGGWAPVAADVDKNGLTELYGIYEQLNPQTWYTRVYEVDSLGNVYFRYQYGAWKGSPRHIVDVDGDGFVEVLLDSPQITTVYTQSSPDSLPTVYKFTHRRFEIGAVRTQQFVGNLDQDTIPDFLYPGDEVDSVSQKYSARQYVSEYSSSINNFERRWSTDFNCDDPARGYGVGDFDGDGKIEFTASTIQGNLWVVENTTSDSFAVVWEDSLPFVNMYWNTAGDVDGDDKPEFFTGATVFSSGTWTVAFEADSNDSYSPRFMIRYLGASFSYPTYTTADVDNDGRLELILFIAGSLMIFKSDAGDTYYLWYFRRFSYGEYVLPYDFAGDKKLEVLISLSLYGVSDTPQQSQIWRPTGITSVREDEKNVPGNFVLNQNYPNPFNPSTTIAYDIPRSSHVRIVLYDVLGKVVDVLVDEAKHAGRYNVIWNNPRVSSGIYFYRLEAGEERLTKKMLLIR